MKPYSVSVTSRVIALATALMVVLAACTLPNTQTSQTFAKPADPPDLEPFLDSAAKMATTTWAANYKIVGTDVTSQLEIIFGGGKAKVATSLGGLTIEIFAGLSPLSVNLCVETTGIELACFDASSILASDESDSSDESSTQSDGESSETDSGGSSTLDTLVGLINVPGTKLTDEMLVPPGAEADCLTSPQTAISNKIKLCVAESGGFLWYSNGELLMQATSFSNEIDPANLNPPPAGGGIAAALG